MLHGRAKVRELSVKGSWRISKDTLQGMKERDRGWWVMVSNGGLIERNGEEGLE